LLQARTVAPAEYVVPKNVIGNGVVIAVDVSSPWLPMSVVAV
jgi:hypothetical protein